ncbi:multiprotein-bridging factor 1 family protein [Actinomadura adrarensis]|uniref:Multiprotein-bridging factor 1 family protein n=1 Tax=Actinomadura adrarensis TaxID=1819600 RepID=A0ABW3C9K5_9ACTN
MNDLLRRALLDADLTETELARHLDVDPKTVKRWIAGRVPYPRYRAKVAVLLATDETTLWPRADRPRSFPEPPTAEILTAYPHRWAVPRHVWQHLFESAEREIGILVYSGLFIAEDAGLLQTITRKARSGARARILLGDPEGPRVLERGTDEGVGDSLPAKIRNALVLYRPLLGIEGIDLRLHDTVLYNSIYRADDDLLINPHAYGVPAAQAPVLHIRKSEPDDMASTYQDSFERAWSSARPFDDAGR